MPAFAETITEVEPNNSAEAAQLLPQIGLNNPVAAAIDIAGDQDWYKFEVVTGRTYVVEVYNLDIGLGRAEGGNCQRYANYIGLGLIVHDNSVTELTRQCAPFAAGNVQNSLVFKATATGLFYLTVLPQSTAENVTGSYMLRILPKHDEPGAVWDESTAEPNSRNEIAYEILPGLNNAQTGTIEERNVGYTTSYVDTDIYRINAVQGRTYVVELFDVDAAIASDGGANCQRYADHKGLAMVLYQPDNVEIAPTLEFHDPSGQITDAETGQPISNAVVTLHRLPNALPDLPGQRRDCRIVSTRGGTDWNALPAAEVASGVAIDPLADALNDRQQINPQANPQITGSEGRYAWDVVEGCWFVVVEAAGYATKVSPVVGVPPAVTDLHLQLEKAANALYLPLVRR